MLGSAPDAAATDPVATSCERPVPAASEPWALQRILSSLVLESEDRSKLQKCHHEWQWTWFQLDVEFEGNFMTDMSFDDAMCQQCESFIYGGCSGTVPFLTLEECRAAKCAPSKCDIKKADVVPPPGTITCAAYWVSWYYNDKTGKCESFGYSACSNLGPFKTLAECEGECVPSKCDITKEDVLSSIGPITCAAFWKSWYYNKATSTCESFSYSACSNLGPFTTLDECYAAGCGIALWSEWLLQQQRKERKEKKTDPLTNRSGLEWNCIGCWVGSSFYGSKT